MLLRDGFLLHAQEYSVLAMLVPLRHPVRGADAVCELLRLLARILVTVVLSQAEHKLIVSLPGRKHERIKAL